MTTYSYAQLEGLWLNAGGSATIAPVMAAIALAESGGRSDAKNPSGATGLWQILGNPFPGNALDPATNAKMAVAKYKSQGLKAWTAYTSGAYKKYLKSGVTADTGVTNVSATGSTSTAQDTGIVGDIGSEIGKGFADALTSLFKPIISIMVWGTEAVLGAALMAFGAYLILSQSAGFKKATTDIGKDATALEAPELAPEIEGA